MGNKLGFSQEEKDQIKRVLSESDGDEETPR
jgi:hypothetical protein